MRIGVVAVVLALAACTSAPGPTASTSPSPTTPSAASPSPPALASPASAARVETSPTPEPPIATLSCPVQPASGHSLALIHDYLPSAPLEIVDVADPVIPVLDCTLSPAGGGRFIGPNLVAFWAGHRLERADLTTGRVAQTATLDATVTQGAFSADGLEFAYRSYSDDTGLSAYVFVNGVERALYVREGIGCCGGPPVSDGPFSRLEFSPDGAELLDYMALRPEPPYLKLFRMDGTAILPRERGYTGVWAPSGHLLYYSADAYLPTQRVFSLDAAGQEKLVGAVTTGGYFWPVISPDGESIVFDSDSTPVPACGGLPNIWRLDLATGNPSRLSKSIAYAPVFVSRSALWATEESQVQCGPGGPGAPDGAVRAFDFHTGADTPVDTSFYVPGKLSTDFVIDVRF